MLINEDENVDAKKSIQMVLNYIAENPRHPAFGFTIDLRQVDGNRKKPKEFLKECK